MSQLSLGAFSETVVRNLSRKLEEPQWLLDFRLKSYQDFVSLPLEISPLYTKYTGVSAFDLGRFGAEGGKEDLDFRDFFNGYLSGKERNISLQGNSTPVHAELDDSLSSQGVRLSTLHQALRESSGLLEDLFRHRLISSSSDRYAAFVNAFFNSGTFVLVPSGVNPGVPLRRMLLTSSPSAAIVEQNFVLAEEGSSLTFLEEAYSKESSGETLVASNLEVRTGPGAKVDYSTVQLLEDGAVNVSSRALDVANDSHTTFSSVSLGAAVTRLRTNFLLNGRGSIAEGHEIFFTGGPQRYDSESNLVHNSPDSTGSTQARGVLKGTSQSVYKGMIKIVKAAKNSRSYLAHHALILERSARSDAIPGLEIDTNEVKATHSASVAQVDEEQLFYLNCRGLDLDDAKKMIVLGFFEPVLSRIPIGQTRDGVRFMIEGKWHGEKRRLADREALLLATGEASSDATETEDIFERHYKYR